MRKNHTLTFNGISLSDFNCYYDGSQLWRKPERLVEKLSVVGKNGDLIIDQGSYSNIQRPIRCFITDHFVKNYNSLLDALTQIEGYGRLESTEEPDVYYMASFVDEIQPDLWQFNEKGVFTLNFDFKPQKWLKSGEIAIPITTSLSITNPSNQIALPLIEVQGTGAITINSSTLTLANNTSTTVIDCETQDCYEGTTNRNSDLTIVGGFPVLGKTNSISYTGFTSVKLKPRWWRL